MTLTRPMLIVFARYPAPGRVKTRLIPALGTHGAALLQHRMTCRTLVAAELLDRVRGIRIELRAAGDVDPMRKLYPGPWDVVSQGEGDLGDRMKRAVGESFTSGAGPVVVIGSDCPGLTAEILAAAFDRLAESDVVIGPAMDGGYCLIGLRRPAPELFDNIAWSTEQVGAQTRAAAERHALSMTELEPLSDVDRPVDLAAIPCDLQSKKISVIIPVLNEAKTIDATLNAVSRLPGILEIIVVDGGSTDDTVARASLHGVRAITSPCGRGTQLHAGALAAVGEVFWFLHADTLPSEDAPFEMESALADSSTVAGNCEIRFDGEFLAARFLTRLYRYLALIGIRYGDSAYFVKREAYLAVGGFRPYPIFEDLDLMRRLRRRGRFVRLQAIVTTSSRRFEGRSFSLVFIRWMILQMLYWVGASPVWLGRRYRHVRLPGRRACKDLSSQSRKERDDVEVAL